MQITLTGLMYVWGILWQPGRHRLRYPQTWPEDRQHVMTAGETWTQVRAQSTHWPSSCAVCPKAMPVDNADDCLPMPQPLHVCSEHVRIVCKVRHSQKGTNNKVAFVKVMFNVWKNKLCPRCLR